MEGREKRALMGILGGSPPVSVLSVVKRGLALKNLREVPNAAGCFWGRSLSPGGRVNSTRKLLGPGVPSWARAVRASLWAVMGMEVGIGFHVLDEKASMQAPKGTS